MVINIFDTDAQFVQEKLSELGHTPMLWSRLDEDEKKRVLDYLKHERESAVIRQVA